MRRRFLPLMAALLMLSACSNTSTPDLNLIMILHCGDNNDACDVEDDNTCEGRGTWGALQDSNEVRVHDNSDKLIKRQHMKMGTFDSDAGTCTFNETINIKSTSRYRIYVDKRGPFDILKSTLEDQEWTAVLEFNT